jgi:negative regulator of flagellin synthesis FlgM
MQVYGPAHLHGPQAVGSPHISRSAPAAQGSESPTIHDELSLSDTARLVEQVHQAPDIRQDRVQSIRAQIASGTYETPDKVNVAVSRLLDEIG